MQPPALGENAKVGVGHLLGQFAQGVVAMDAQLRIAEQDQVGFEAFRHDAMLACMIDQPAGEIEFAHAAARPVDDFGRQHTADAEFLAKTKQQDIDAGRVGIGQLGEVANAHHHGITGILLACLEVSPQRGGETEGDRFDHRIDAKADVARLQIADCIRQRVEGSTIAFPRLRGRVRYRDDLAPPITGGLAIRPVHTEDQFRARPGGLLGFPRIETVDRQA